MLVVAEVLGHGERGQSDAPARTGRFVHLTKDENGAFEHAGGAHVGQQFVPFARPLADTRKDRNALVTLHHGVDQFHHQDRLAHTRATEHRRLAALRQRHEQVQHLDAGLEHSGRRRLLRQFGRRAMDRPARRFRWQ